MATTKRVPSTTQPTLAELIALDRDSALVFELARDGILEASARLLTEQFGFSIAWLGEVRDDQHTLVIRHTSGNRTDQFHGLAFRSGCGLGGKVFAQGGVQWVDDYFASVSITHDYDEQVASEGICRMIAAPMVWEGRPIAVLFGASRDSGTYGTHAAAIVELVADRAVAALGVAQRSQRDAELAVGQERRRIADHLDDGVGSMLLAIGANARNAAAHPRVDATLKDRLGIIERQADTAASTLRESVRGLRSASKPSAPLAAPDGRPQPAAVPPRLGASASDVVSDTGRTELFGRADVEPRDDSRSLVARREYDVLLRVAIGATNAQIADELGLSVNTIKTYLRNVMTKLGARNRIEAILRARQLGLL